MPKGSEQQDSWQPATYLRFADERSRPFFDLAALVRGPALRVVDLGCGPGQLTAQLPALVGARFVLGLDNSPAMLEAAAAHAKPGEVEFAEGDLETWQDTGQWDLVFANAALQWVPDHGAVIERWRDALKPGGQLAIQVPRNGGHASHYLSRALALEQPYADAWAGDPPADPADAHVLAPEAYAVLLDGLGFVDVTVRLQVYLHRLANTAAVVDWVRGTSLTRFEKKLTPELYAAFVAEYRRRLIAEVGDHAPYLYTFQRVLMHARLP